jgi:hypothetical protein
VLLDRTPHRGTEYREQQPGHDLDVGDEHGADRLAAPSFADSR